MSDNGWLNVGWFLTDTCNLRCKHCYHNGFKENNVDYSSQKEMDLRVIDNIIELGKSWEIDTIGILGGEPMLNPHIFEYFEEIRGKLSTKFCIATNGLLISDNDLLNIKNSNDISIQISLDSPIKEVHEYYRGKGTYDKTLDIIKKIVTQGINISLKMTVSNINFDQIEEFAIFGVNLGVNCVSINKYISDKNYINKYMHPMNKKEHSLFLEKIFNLKIKYGDDVIVTEDPSFNYYSREEIKLEFEEELRDGFIIGGCSAGISNVTIDGQGNVYPCTLMNTCIGNINSERLLDIWEGRNEILNELRSRSESLKGKCKNCKHLLYCGGCRAAALKMEGDYLGEDPFCCLNEVGDVH